MKKISALSALLLLILCCLASCELPSFGPNTDKPGGNGQGGGEEPENLIYNGSTELYLVYDPEEVTFDLVERFAHELLNASGVALRPYDMNSEPKPHEIVIGDVGRPVSDAAYDQLERINLNSNVDLRYCIYSDGSSLAIAFDEDRDKYCFDQAIETFLKDYVKEELILVKGAHTKVSFNLYDYLGERDMVKYAEQWQKLSEAYPAEVVSALKSYYAIYDGEKLVSWLANLYDPDICVCKGLYGEKECSGKSPVCGTGGFYFSNSARDTVGFLPDVESTLQALGLLAALGMDSSYVRLLPEEMGEKMANFVYNLQDEDGFFYHPQWGKSIGTPRRSRDFNWSKNILSAYGKKSRYPLADEGGAVPSSSLLTPKFGASAVSAVSKVAAVSDANVPAHLKTLDAFKNYLENTLDFKNAAYPAGNELSSQASQIRARGQEYIDAMFEHLNSTQNKNGTWHPTAGYYAVNGLMKISGIYKDFGREIPNAEAACLACFDAIMSNDDPGAIVDVWNAWVAITYVFENVRLFAPNGEEKEAQLKATLVENSVDAIEETKKKTYDFVRVDGSYGYYAGNNCLTSQGAPVAINTDVIEGDVNGCMIATTQMINFVFAGLGMNGYKVDLCGERERAILLDMLENLSPNIKQENKDAEGEPISFDYEDVGENKPTDVTVSIGDTAKGSKVIVKEDTRSGASGNILSFNTASDSYDSISFNNKGASAVATCYVYEAEMCISEASPSVDFLRIEMGNSDDISGVYRIAFRKKGDRIDIVDNSSSDSNQSMVNYLGASVSEGEWFKIRIEYYPADGSEAKVRAKVYFNDKLLAVSDNYYDYYGKKLVGKGVPNTKATLTRLQFLKGVSAEVLLDNVHTYSSRNAYKAEPLHSDYLANPYSVNVDSILSSAPVYGFDDGSIPESFTVNAGTGAADVTDGKLTLSGDASVNIPAIRTNSFPNVAVIKMDIFASSSVVGDAGSAELRQNGRAEGVLNRYTFKAETVNGEKVLKVTESAKGTAVAGFLIPTGVKAELKIEYYYKDNVVLFYLDSELLGMSTEFSDMSKRYVFDDILITGNAGITLDNICVELSNKDYTSTMDPKYDSLVHGFENGLGDIITAGSGVSVRTEGENSHLEIMTNSSSSVKVPFNSRDDIMNVSVAEFKLKFTNTTKKGSHIISLVNASDEKIVSFAIGQKDGKGYICENTALGTHKSVIAEFALSDMTAVSFELYESIKTCKLIVDGKCVMSKTLLYSDENSALTPEYLTFEAPSSAPSVILDDIVFDRLRKVYVKEESENKENGSEKLTFSYSGGSDLPNKVTSEINSLAALPSVAEVNKNGEPDKVLRFDTVSGAGDKLKIKETSSLAGAASQVFEAQIMFPETSGASFQIYICDPAENIVTIYYFTVENKELYFYHESFEGVQTDKFKIGRLGEWIDLKIEYYAVKEGTLTVPKIKTYIGGDYITEYSYQYKRNDMSRAGSIMFYGLSGKTGTMYIDDISFYASTKTYE